MQLLRRVALGSSVALKDWNTKTREIIANTNVRTATSYQYMSLRTGWMRFGVRTRSSLAEASAFKPS